MYPINLHNAAAGGYACANDEAEHRALSEAGYEPKWQGAAVAASAPQASEPAGDSAESVDSLRVQLDAAGIPYDKRWGLAKLKAALTQE